MVFIEQVFLCTVLDQVIDHDDEAPLVQSRADPSRSVDVKGVLAEA